MRATILFVIDPHSVVHIGAGILVRHVAIAAVVAGVAEEEHASAGLFRIVPIADNQHAVSVDNAFRRRRFEDVVLPPHRFLGPAKAPADRPLFVEHMLDPHELLIGQSRIRIPPLDPMQPEPNLVQLPRAIPRFPTGLSLRIELLLVGHIPLRACAVDGKTPPQV